jgi:putative zinc-binding metallo-peptidase
MPRRAKRYRIAKHSISQNGQKPHWADFSDAELLQVRMCDLKLRIQGTPLERRIDKLYKELESREIPFRPHCWLSDEWFSPDGVPGIAIPFYLAHPRLARLERRQVLEVEGGTEEWCMRILRHEAGHALDTAYGLHRRRRWREAFGKYSEPYPDYYNPRPYSKSFVVHLDSWYAQSHPAEDFAETFAVWLKPRSGWKSHYRGWPAMKKLEYVDQAIQDIIGKKPTNTCRQHVAGLRQTSKTLGEHYREKRGRYGLDHPNFHDRDLRRVFSNDPECADFPAAATYLRKIRPELRRLVAHWTGEYQYTIDQVLGEMIESCRQLKLRVDRTEESVRRDMLVMLTVQTMNYLHAGHHRVAL